MKLHVKKLRTKIFIHITNMVTGLMDILDGLVQIISLGFIFPNLSMKWISFISKKMLVQRLERDRIRYYGGENK